MGNRLKAMPRCILNPQMKWSDDRERGVGFFQSMSATGSNRQREHPAERRAAVRPHPDFCPTRTRTNTFS